MNLPFGVGVPAFSISSHQARERPPVVVMSQRPLNCSSPLTAGSWANTSTSLAGRENSTAAAKLTPRLRIDEWFLITMIGLLSHFHSGL